WRRCKASPCKYPSPKDGFGGWIDVATRQHVHGVHMWTAHDAIRTRSFFHSHCFQDLVRGRRELDDKCYGGELGWDPAFVGFPHCPCGGTRKICCEATIVIGMMEDAVEDGRL